MPNLSRTVIVSLMDEYLSRTKRTARKAHTCNLAYASGVVCDGTIRPGEDYFDEVAAPWTQFVEDVDDDGRAYYTKLGEWQHSRTHVSCFNGFMDYWVKFNR